MTRPHAVDGPRTDEGGDDGDAAQYAPIAFPAASADESAALPTPITAAEGGVLEDSALNAILADLRGASLRRPRGVAAAKRTAQPPTAPTPTNMPLWSEDSRAVLHDLVRSALFTCGQKAPRQQLKSAAIKSVSNVTIVFTGEELRQREHDVYQMLCHGLRAKALNARIWFSGRSMIGALKWSDSGRSYKELVDAFRRLKACSLEVESRLRNGRRVRYAGSLIADWYIAGDDEDQLESAGALFGVQLNPRIAAIFAPGQFSRIDWEARLRLSPLGKWLQTFFCSHSEPFPYKVETIHGLSGSNAKHLRQFRAELKRTGSNLVAEGILASFTIDELDRVVVTRTHQSPAQPAALTTL